MDLQPKRAACDRCRAQKLRCVYPDSVSVFPVPCERCRRAHVTCNRSPSLRMGRRPGKPRSRSAPQVSSENIKPIPQPVTPTRTNNQRDNRCLDSLAQDSLTGIEFDIDNFLSMTSNTTTTPNDPPTFRVTTPELALAKTNPDYATLSPLSHPLAFPNETTGNPDFDFGNCLVTTTSHSSHTLSMDSSESSYLMDLGTESSSSEHSFPNVDPFDDVLQDLAHIDMDNIQGQQNHKPSLPVRHMKALSQLTIDMQNLLALSGNLQSRVDSPLSTVQDATNGPTLNTVVPGNSSKRVISGILHVSQRFLDILKPLQCNGHQLNSVCPQLRSCDGPLIDAFKSNEPDAVASCQRPDPQTILHVIGCFVQLLRLYSDVFSHVSDLLSTHSSSPCTYLPHSVPDLQIKNFPVETTGHLQLLLLVQTLTYLLDAIELALGCHRTSNGAPKTPARAGRWQSGAQDSSSIKPQCLCCFSSNKHSHSPVEPKVDSGGLLSRHHALDLLETMLKCDDLESKDRGRRSLRMLRSDIEHVKELLEIR